MISKILKLQNIGLLQDAAPSGAVALGKATAIYADNGRGKSTFAAVLRACQLGDAGRLNARKTIDATSNPEVKFLLPSGSHVEFTANAWTATLPDIVVFDSEFVELNVYSGSEVRADQRQSLLEFALGDQTVQLKQQIDRLTQEIEVQTRRRTQAERTLTGFAQPLSVPLFVALQPVSNAQQQIDALRKRIEAAKNAEQLAARKDPVEIARIPFNVPASFTILRTQLQDVEKTAEAVVRAHLEKHNAQDFEDWVSRGQEYLTNNECPLCSQPIGGLELVDSYRSYFSDAYGKLKQEVIALQSQVRDELADARVDAAVAAAATNAARVEAWKDQLSLIDPIFDALAVRAAVATARELLLSLVAAKQRAPLESIGSAADLATAGASTESVERVIEAYNVQLRERIARIGELKAQLAAENIALLLADIKKLEAAQKRELAEVQTAAAEYQAAEAERKRLDADKTQTRQQLDVLMQTTLKEYQESINDLLKTFGAEFSIEQLQPTYLGGGEPRTDYRLNVRSKPVRLGGRSDLATNVSFATTLSEADKRTLAFAFFVARLKSDSKLADQLIVLDDPVSSLDRNRRHQSIRQIGSLAGKCRQLLVLSHDAYFLRDLRDHLAKIEPAPIELRPIRISRTQLGYSAFASCDLDEICSSDYYRNHRLVADYVDGKTTGTTREVAKAIRPLMEGYYHRRFPGRIPKNAMFGRVIELATDAVAPDPLAYLKPILAELSDVNEYAKQFHHDGGDTIPISDPELLQFATKALDLIYKNG